MGSGSADARARASAWMWTALLALCAIGALVAVRRIVVLLEPPAVAATPELAATDAAFASRRVLTLCHLFPALLFVILLPLWFSRRVRARTEMHRAITLSLFGLGAVIGVTALGLSLHPFGGLNEATAAVFYDLLFLFSLGRAGLLFARGNLTLHREWMMRAIAVLLGIATTRPVMGVFFATSRITHMQPQQFFGTAFWIGFTITYIAGEAYIRSHPVTGVIDPA